MSTQVKKWKFPYTYRRPRRKLPDFDDEFAQMASEFDTADELRVPSVLS